MSVLMNWFLGFCEYSQYLVWNIGYQGINLCDGVGGQQVPVMECEGPWCEGGQGHITNSFCGRPAAVL